VPGAPLLYSGETIQQAVAEHAIPAHHAPYLDRPELAKDILVYGGQIRASDL